LTVERVGRGLLASRPAEPVPDLADRRPRRRPRGPGGGDQGRHREQRGDDSPCAGRQGTDGRRTPTHRYDTLLHPARLTVSRRGWAFPSAPQRRPVTTPPRQCGTGGTDGNTSLSWGTADWSKAMWVPVAGHSASQQHLLSAGDAGRGQAFDDRFDLASAGILGERRQDRVTYRRRPAARPAAIIQR